MMVMMMVVEGESDTAAAVEEDSGFTSLSLPFLLFLFLYISRARARKSCDAHDEEAAGARMQAGSTLIPSPSSESIPSACVCVRACGRNVLIMKIKFSTLLSSVSVVVLQQAPEENVCMLYIES